MSAVFTSTIGHTLKDTLDDVVDDPMDGFEKNAQFTEWCKMRPIMDNYADDLQMGGVGRLPVKTEGGELATMTIREGYVTRYRPLTYGAKLIVSKEAIDDCKYPEAIAAARRLKKALWKTADIDATLMLARGWDTAYPGGDGLPLFSASHTIPSGGTYSNTLATPYTPSVAALTVMTSAIRKLPGNDGEIEGFEPTKILSPTEQWAEWSAILNSKFDPEAGNFAKINVVKENLRISVISIKQWTNSATNWCMLTDCDQGPQWRWRKKPESNTWVENDNQTMKYSVSARWARGWSDPRGAYGSQA